MRLRPLRPYGVHYTMNDVKIWCFRCACGRTSRRAVPVTQLQCSCGLRWILQENLFSLWSEEGYAG